MDVTDCKTSNSISVDRKFVVVFLALVPSDLSTCVSLLALILGVVAWPQASLVASCLKPDDNFHRYVAVTVFLCCC
jgi:hypothetical protein